MRISKRHRAIIEVMEANGYVWLSNLPANAIMRFRYRTRKGFKGFIKIAGLTFLTKRVADIMTLATTNKNAPRLSLREQNQLLEQQLVELESENYALRKKDLETIVAKLEEKRLM